MSRSVATSSTDQTIAFWAFDADGDAVEVTTSDTVAWRRDISGREGTPTTLTLTTRDVAGTHKDAAITYKGDGKHEVDLPDTALSTNGEVTLEVTKSGVASVYVEKITVAAALATAATLGTPAGASIAEDIAAVAGDVSINVLPATGIVATRSPGATLNPVVGETISQAITLYETDGTTPVSVAGKTLAIVFETLAGVDVAVVASGSITISGASSNVVTFAYPSAVTSAERTLRFAIRDASAPLTMYLQGICNVVKAPQVDA